MSHKETLPASCAGMDHGGCGLMLTIEDGRVTAVKGGRGCPQGSDGYICVRGKANLERLSSPNRLTRPLRRLGDRGSGSWEEVSWEEALDQIALNLTRLKERHGPETVAFMQGAAKGLEFMTLFRFAHAFGSPNVVTPSGLCFMPRVGAAILTSGFYPVPDYQGNPGCILVWGSNVTATNADGVLAVEVLRALKKKPKLIVVDPRRTALAAKADIWLQLRPGSDAALAIGMLKVIVENGWYDREFVTGWTVGFEELQDRLNVYSWDAIEKATWIAGEQITAAARMYVENRPACLQWGNALDQNHNGVQGIRAILTLSAICGNLEIPGGDIRPPTLPLLGSSDFTLKDRTKDCRPIISSQYPLANLFGFVPYQLAVEAMITGRPYPLRAAYIQASNPLLTYPDAHRAHQALTGLEFLVVADLFMTPTAALADIVLPVAARLEYDDLGFYTHPFGRVLARPKVTEPPGECRSDLTIVSDLAGRMGFGDLFWAGETDCLEAILAPSGKSYRRFKEEAVLAGETKYYQYKDKGFRTPSGKFEIASRRLKSWGLDPLPSAVLDLPEPNATYPLILTSGKSPYYFHSANHHLPSIRRHEPEPLVTLNPTTAARFGIAEGDTVCIATATGRIEQKATLSPGVDPRVVIASFGWWFPEKGWSSLFGWDKANLNVLTSAAPPYDPVIGSVTLRGIPCAVCKVN